MTFSDLNRPWMAVFTTLAIWVAIGSFVLTSSCTTLADTTDAKVIEAVEFLESGRYAEAIPLLREVLKDVNRSSEFENLEIAQANNLLGFALARSGRSSEAIPHHQEALRIFRIEIEEATPELARTYSLLGHAHLLGGQTEQAEPFCRKALELSIDALGKTHADTAGALNDLGYVLRVRGRWAEARSLLEQASKIYAQTLGSEHPRSALTRTNLAELLELEGNYTAALAEYKAVLRIQQSSLGEQHPDVARSHGNIGWVYLETADYLRAKEHYEIAVDIMAGSRHHDRARYLSGLGSIHSRLGEYSEALGLFEEAHAIYRAELGEEHPNTLSKLDNIATVLQKAGRLTEAEAIYRRNLETSRKQHGPKSVEVAHALSNLATVREDLGDLTEARELLEESLEIRDAKLSDHPKTAVTLTNLAHVLKALGELVVAEQHYRRALRIRVTGLGPEHPKTAASHNNLGASLEERGDLSGARDYYEKALEVRRKILPANHPDIAISLNNLGLILGPLGEHLKADAYLREAYKIRVAIYGLDHPAVAISLENLAPLARMVGDLEEEVELHRRALQIRIQSLGSKNPDVANSHNNLAYTLLRSRSFSEAEKHFERALAIREAAFGPNHPDVASCLDGLAIVAELNGDPTSAVNLVQRAQEIRERWIRAPLDLGDDRAKRALVQRSRYSMEHAVSLHFRNGSKAPAAGDLAVTAILRNKGRALETSAAERRSLGYTKDPEVVGMYEEILALRASEIRKTLRSGDSAGDDAAQELAATRLEIRRLESQLAEQLPASGASRSIDIASVRAALPDRSALIEFVAFEPFYADRQPNPWGDTHYAAYWIQSSGPITAVDLGPAEPIDREVGQFREALESGNPSVFEDGRRLYKMLMGPFGHVLDRVESLYIAPDGELLLLPFAALVGPERRYLLEDKIVSYLTSGRSLLEAEAPPEKEEPRNPPLLIGGPDFGLIPGEGSQRNTSPALDYLPESYLPLPGAQAEVEWIGRVCELPSDRVLTGKAATETALVSARGPVVLHLATHGFFLADLPSSTFRAWPEPSVLRKQDLPSWDEYRAGIALAGYNQRHLASDADDGVLTAHEMTALDLVGTEIVVLSACQTGVGESRYGQGVFGMRRALALAGARSQLTTLWPVDDEATRSLMVDWYQHLGSGLDRARALRRAQLKILKKSGVSSIDRGPKAATSRGGCRVDSPCEADKGHPRYWAAFVLSGETGPIDLGAACAAKIPTATSN